jgi:nucleoside-diphosphate-sugar epimerase
MRVLIIGCGYVGLPLGAELVRRGHEVFGVQRQPVVEPQNVPDERRKFLAEIKASRWQGVKPIAADITRREDLEKIPGQFDWVINTVSSGKGGLDEYRAVFLEGTRNLLNWLSANPPQKFIYTSSTSVYGQTDGSWVTEESPAEPQSDTSLVLVEAEKLLLAAAKERNLPANILRLAGIYGPERGHLFQQYLRGEARLDGEGARFINMIHRDDAVAGIIAALERGRAGEIYNVADDEPVTQRKLFEWLSVELNGPMPPRADTTQNATRKRGLTHKRVANRKLRLELGCELKYPTFRQGYAAEIAKLRTAGILNFPDAKN